MRSACSSAFLAIVKYRLLPAAVLAVQQGKKLLTQQAALGQHARRAA